MDTGRPWQKVVYHVEEQQVPGHSRRRTSPDRRSARLYHQGDSVLFGFVGELATQHGVPAAFLRDKRFNGDNIDWRGWLDHEIAGGRS